VPQVAESIRKTLQSHCGVFRNQALLSEGVAKVMELEQRDDADVDQRHSQVFNTARVEALELDNLIEVAKATVIRRSAARITGRASAQRLPESRRRQLAEAHALVP
jgi:succinate dehydrogenase / fumarate reductase flavoprotein subunit